MHTEITKIEQEIRNAILISARQYVRERANSKISRVRLTWAFGRACIQAGGWLMSTVILLPRGCATEPAQNCLRVYGDLARKFVDGETL